MKSKLSIKDAKKKKWVILILIVFTVWMGYKIFDDLYCGMRVAKPVIYLYPEVTSEVSVSLDFEGDLTCTYPEYNKGWDVIAQPDGTLINKADNKEYSYLYWEGDGNKDIEINQGFVVKGSKTAEFLQDKLSLMGMVPKEYNEFIVYWLPIMQEHEYNVIYFAGEEYAQMAELKIIPEPDSMLRVFMVFKELDGPIEIEEQEIRSFERKGFSVVEWGGGEL